ncbi:glucokinase [Candidatus Woesearchaeota archaeon]|nr:glucokinase [Candidatus Woesearchaeota archaeon]
MVKKLLVGDVGGTNTFLGVIQGSDLLKVKEFKTKNVVIYEELSNFLDEYDVKGVSLAVAGPVINGRVSLSNVDKIISSKKLSDLVKQDVLLLNDFEALGFFVKDKTSKGLVIGAGTGLGKVVVSDKVMGTEGGGVDFPFFSGEENIKDFFSKKLKRHPSYEDLVSGRGLSMLKQYYVKKNRVLSNNFSPSDIFSNNKDVVNKKVIKDFSKFYGRFVKNSSLELLPDKVFIAGGIARKNPEIIKSEEFLNELSVLSKKPRVSLIKDKYAGLKGAASAFFHKNI